VAISLLANSRKNLKNKAAEMPLNHSDDRLNLYKSLFKGRADLFALRWEKGGKSSYMPAYSFDPHRYRQHQIKGGTFQTFTDKTLLP
jgi:hypothetical protein